MASDDTREALPWLKGIDGEVAKINEVVVVTEMPSPFRSGYRMGVTLRHLETHPQNHYELVQPEYKDMTEKKQEKNK